VYGCAVRQTITLAIALALCCALPARARADTDVRVDIEPAAYILRGYSIHLASTVPGAPRVSVGATLYGFDVPGMLVGLGHNDSDAWDVRLRIGYGVFADAFLDPSRRDGWLVGTQIGFQQYRARGPAPATTDAIFTDVMVLVRAGYEWHPLRARHDGAYLMPWVGAAYTTPVSGDPGLYDVFPVLPYAACDLGWRF
jgi:hypothetical protein